MECRSGVCFDRKFSEFTVSFFFHCSLISLPYLEIDVIGQELLTVSSLDSLYHGTLVTCPEIWLCRSGAAIRILREYYEYNDRE